MLQLLTLFWLTDKSVNSNDHGSTGQNTNFIIKNNIYFTLLDSINYLADYFKSHEDKTFDSSEYIKTE